MKAIQVIRNFYAEKGFLNVKVVIREDRDSVLRHSVIPRFLIDKGEAVKIHNITF